MNFKQAKLDDQDILKDSSSGIYYSQREWRRLTVSDEVTPIAGYHGVKSSPVYARTRVITLQGIIDRIGNDNEESAVSYLQSLFVLQGNTSELIGRSLYIKDMYDAEWTLPVKVKTPIEFAEYDDSNPGIAWKWSVTLESIGDPTYKSFAEKNISGTESNYGGISFPTSFPVAFDSFYNKITCENIGNSETPARIEITATGDIGSPLKILNITDGSFFGLDITASAGDVIIIDSNDFSATKNGINVLANRIAGSIFPMILGVTEFSITDIDGGIPSNDFNINILFKDSLL